jgi:hypothetical protein
MILAPPSINLRLISFDRSQVSPQRVHWLFAAFGEPHFFSIKAHFSLFHFTFNRVTAAKVGSFTTIFVCIAKIGITMIQDFFAGVLDEISVLKVFAFQTVVPVTSISFRVITELHDNCSYF